MMLLPPEDHARLYRDRLLEEKLKHDLRRQAGARPFYTPLLALLGRALTDFGLWLQARSTERHQAAEQRPPVDTAMVERRWQGAR
ncbi:MAG: hypothetical protein HPY64_08910 [Anaerolineae bacterium]|nr:hypothetical protein [Anaerolineae bacterium]